MRPTLSATTVRRAAPRLARAAVACLLLAGTAALAQPAPAAPEPGSVELAQRLSDLAQNFLRGKEILPPHWRLAGAFLDAAGRLDPDNGRYPRLAADAYLGAHDPDAAIRSLEAFRAIDREDAGAQTQLIDLYVNRFESADQRLAYLQKVIAATAVAEEIRSFAAARAARLSIDRGDNAGAIDFAEQALKLNPVNLDALRIKYVLTADKATPAQRVDLLLAVLRANPAQLDVITHVAQELADVGLVDASLKMYGVAAAKAPVLGGVSRDFALGHVSELLISANPESVERARGILDQVLTADPYDVEALLLRGVMLKAAIASGTPEAHDLLAKDTQQAINAAYNRVVQIRNQWDPAAAAVPLPSSATTREATAAGPVAWPDFNADAKALEDPKFAALKPHYARAVADAAWIELYLAERPADARPLIDGAKSLGTDEPTLNRLDGWYYILRNELDSARVKVTAVSDRDPLAALAAIRLANAAAKTPADKEQVARDAQALFAAHPSGIVGAELWQELSTQGVKQTPRDEAGGIEEAFNKFPLTWFDLIDKPNTFYTLRAEPLRVAHKFGMPILARVTVENVGDYDLTVGPDGALRPDLWFDAEVRGRDQRPIPNAAFDHLSQRLVLHPRGKPGSTATQIVRLDQGAVAAQLNATPLPAKQVMFFVRLNPSTTKAGGVFACGQAAAFDHLVERTSFPLTPAGQQLLTQTLTTGEPGDKIRFLDLLDSLFRFLVPAVRTDPQAQQSAMSVFGLMKDRALHDTSPPVLSWSAFLVTRLGDAKRVEAVDRILADKTWHGRLLGLLLATTLLPRDAAQLRERQLAQSDADAQVRDAARALVDLGDYAPAAAAPATAPSPTDPTAGRTPAPTPPPLATPRGTTPPSGLPTGTRPTAPSPESGTPSLLRPPSPATTTPAILPPAPAPTTTPAARPPEPRTPTRLEPDVLGPPGGK